MKLLPVLCSTLLASAVLSAGVASATNLNSSRSNIYRLDPSDPNGEKACTDSGGAVSTDKDGQKICTKPEPASSTTVKSSKSNTSD